MTAQPHDFAPGSAPEPAKSLRAIRASLVVPQDREAFDAGLKAVLDEVPCEPRSRRAERLRAPLVDLRLRLGARPRRASADA